VSGSTALTGALSTARLPAEPRSGPAAGYRIDLRLSGEGRRWSLLDVYRLAPLGTTRSGPLVVFLGVRGDKHTAVFAVAGKSVNTGAGRCLPTRADCQVIELRKGHTEFLDTVVDDQVVRYRLTVDAIAQRHASTRARAARVLRRRSRAGEKIVSALVASGHTYVDRYEYSRLRGIVIRHDAATASSRPPVAAGALIPAQ
jgi:hypothetical protein